MKNRYPCLNCEHQATDKSNLKHHNDRIHLGMKKEKKKYDCSICEARIIGKEHLKAHIRLKHLDSRKFKCDICGFETSFKNNLARHMNTHKTH